MDTMTAEQMYLSAIEILADNNGHNTKKAFILLKKAAELNYAKAQHKLGTMYEVRRRYADAVYWYMRAAGNGHSDAIKDLGYMYENGLGGLEQDLKHAVELYRRSAQMNNPHAQVCLGFMYEKGLGVDKNIETAKYWYRLSVENGSWATSANLKRLDEQKH